MAYARKGIVQGALILTAAGLVTRLLGFAYRIYMSNAIGAEGMGLYQLIMPVYSLAWSLSCAGFTTTVSKIVSAENAGNEHGNMGRALKQSMLITLSLGVVLMLALYIGAGWLGASVFNDNRAALPLRVLAFALPFMAAGSCIRGYFFGLHESRVPAVSQVFEQVVRMGAVFAMAPMFARGLEYAVAAAVVGIVCGEALSFIYVLYAYRSFKLKQNFSKPPTTAAPAMLAAILSAALPLTANRVTGSLLTMAENTLIPLRLQSSGMTRVAAMSAFGKVTGMALPLIFFPSALLVSLSIALVPAISEAAALGNKPRVTSLVSKTALFTGLVAMPAAAVFAAFPGELGMAIYKQDIRDQLLMLGLMCPLWYLSVAFGGILNGLGQQGFLFRNSLLASVITITCIWFFVPLYGVNAFIGGWFAALFATTALSLRRVAAASGVRVTVFRWFVKPGLAAALAGLTAKWLSRGLFAAFGAVFGLIASAALLGGIYVAAVFLLKCVTVRDVRSVFSRRRKGRLV